MSSIEQEPIVSSEFWDEEARSERIGAGLTFIIGLGLATAGFAELSENNIGLRISAIPLIIIAYEALKFGFEELNEANRIEVEHHI